MSRHDDFPGSSGSARVAGRYLLIGVAVLYMALFLLLPLITVFVQAFS